MNVSLRESRVLVDWDDGRQSAFHATWLRDNCPCRECLHAGTGERLVDVTLLDDGIAAASARALDGDDAEIVWAGDGHVSRFPGEWLRAQAAKGGRTRPERTLWRAELASRIPAGRYGEVVASDEALRDWLAAVDEYGFALLHDVPIAPGEVARFVERFGYVRETNYGRVFDVKTVVNPNNLAYSSLALGPHTDNAYRDPPPTLQLLHCLASSARGGENTVVDGFAVAEALRSADEAAFDVLARHPILFEFRDAETELASEAPVIALDARGEVAAIHFSTRAAAPFRLPPDLMEPYYDAYRTFGRLLVSAEFRVEFRLEPGDLFIVDNLRVLHGRNGYSGEGARHLQGCYADIDGLRSRLAVLRACPESRRSG